MGVKTALSRLISTLEDHDIRYALMGGFALGLWDDSRLTVELNFIVSRNDMQKVDKIMSSFGYSCNYKSENVSQFSPPPKISGEVVFFARIEGDILNQFPEG